MPAPGQTATASFTSVTPNDITVSINNNGAGPQGMVFNPQTPSINTDQFTGGFTGVNGIQLIVSSSQVFGAYIQTTISFATPVANLSFQLWDVDAKSGQYADKIANIQALAFGGGTRWPRLGDECHGRFQYDYRFGPEHGCAWHGDRERQLKSRLDQLRV